MSYDLQIVNPFQTLNGLIALWAKTFSDNIDQRTKDELENKLIKAHKVNLLFEHNMIMTAFAVFYEKFGSESHRWTAFNRLIPYINENALIETKTIIQKLNNYINKDANENLMKKAKESANTFKIFYKIIQQINPSSRGLEFK